MYTFSGIEFSLALCRRLVYLEALRRTLSGHMGFCVFHNVELLSFDICVSFLSSATDPSCAPSLSFRICSYVQIVSVADLVS